MILKNARLIYPDRLELRGSIRVLDGKIAAIFDQAPAPEPGEDVIDVDGSYLAPGFIDLHIHGGMRRDTMEATAEALEAICQFHASGGTTSLALTTVTASAPEIVQVIEAVRSYQASPAFGAQVLGVHLEGPYFSKDKPGAHDLALIRTPDTAEWKTWLANKETITQITLAPELPGALPLIEAFAEAGIRVSGGHSNAWDEEAAAGFAHGMRQVTHTFNCMSAARHRGAFRVAGLLEFALSEPEIVCELIADGRHVSPTLMRMLYHAKGPDGIVLITDATAGAGLAEGDTFELLKLPCVVRDQVGMTSDGEVLAGSTSTMMRCVGNMVRLAGVPLVEAVRMATLNPARALGLEKEKGLIALGATADLVVFNADFSVSHTFVGGKELKFKN